MVLATSRYVDLVELVPRRRPRDDEDPGPLAHVLVRLRGESGMTQKQVAKLAGFDQGYYSNLETGVIKNPSDEKMESLDRAFGLEVGTIKERKRAWPRLSQSQIALDDPDFEILPPELENEFTVMLRRVPPHRRRRAVEIILDQAEVIVRAMTDEELK